MSTRVALRAGGGALLVALAAAALGGVTGPALTGRLERQAAEAVADAGGTGVTARFTGAFGWASRHPVLHGGEALPEPTRAAVARAVGAVPGVGGVHWAAAPQGGTSGAPKSGVLHCQQDVEGLLKTRSIRFEEGSSALLPASNLLLDEVAEALRPCRGSLIAIEGHTDGSGSEPANLALSMERARAVREALVGLGISRRDLRARGMGSSEPISGLAPEDPANRRIEFSVIRKQPLAPTPVDTPGAY